MVIFVVKVDEKRNANQADEKKRSGNNRLIHAIFLLTYGREKKSSLTFSPQDFLFLIFVPKMVKNRFLVIKNKLKKKTKNY